VMGRAQELPARAIHCLFRVDFHLGATFPPIGGRMRAVTRFLGILGVLAVAGPRQVAAQHPQTREGFWIGFGFGYGSAKASCDGCGTSSGNGGVTGFLKLGGTLSKQVLLGGEVNAWTKSDSGVTTELGNVSAAVYYYPAVKSGFFLKGGLGFSTFRAHDGGSIDGTGVGFLAGL